MTTSPSQLWGTLVSSDSEGKYFISLLTHVNHNLRNIPDVTRVEGLEGILIANRVSNPEQVSLNLPKKIKSYISYDDGIFFFFFFFGSIN